jgi:GxxExxY protein
MHDNKLTERIIACAIEVHRALGPGLLEGAYQAAMSIEFDLAGLKVEEQLLVPAKYKGRLIGMYRIDFVVERAVVVEVKAVQRTEPVFTSQILTYMRVTKIAIGLLINFNAPLVTEGIRRFVL